MFKQKKTGDNWKLFSLLLFITVTLTLISPLPAVGEEQNSEYVKGQIVYSPSASEISPDSFVTDVKVQIVEGTLAGKIFDVPIPNQPPYSMTVEKGDKVMVIIERSSSPPTVGIDDYYRLSWLLPILLISILPVIIVGGKKGLAALGALAVTVFTIFGITTRILLKGYPPVITGILACAIITTLTLFIISGKGKKTIVAVSGTLGGLCCAALLAWFATWTLHLSGLSGHESIFLQGLDLKLDFKGLLLTAMIIGALGAVMDVCMSIASSLEELALKNPDISPSSLLSSGLKIGSDMLGTMTNTLVLAYTGSSLTLILLIEAQGAEFPLLRLMNMEFICVEIVRSASGLFGMATAIPVSALVASLLFTKAKRQTQTVNVRSKK